MFGGIDSDKHHHHHHILNVCVCAKILFSTRLHAYPPPLPCKQLLCARYEIYIHSYVFVAVAHTVYYLVDPASSHMLVSKIKPCMSKYIPY